MIELLQQKEPAKSPLILIVSTKFDPHVDILVKTLTERHLPFVRFNSEDFPLKASLAISFSSDIHEERLKVPNNKLIRGDDITSVWYRRPAPSEFPKQFSPQARAFAERETTATIRGLWSLLDCIWVNHPDNNRIAEIKLNQLKRAIQLGLEIPSTLVTNNPAEARRFVKSIKSDVIVKSLTGGLIPDDVSPTAIFTSILRPEDTQHLADIRFTPTLFQEYTLKSVEIRVNVVGDKVFAAEIHSQQNPKTLYDWRHDTLNLSHKVHQLPEDIAQKCLALVRSFNLNFGAIDMILTPKDRYVFLELNPNGQWAWIEDLTGLPIADALIEVLTGRISD